MIYKRIAKDRQILSVKPIERADLAMLKSDRVKPVTQRLRDPHHRVARLFAIGLRQHEVVARSGYSYNRVHTLSIDPTFQELVASYRDKVDAAFISQQDDYYELATSNMLKAERQIAEKLEAADEEGELLPTKDLIAISRDAADRFGYGKKQTNLNVNVDFASQLEKAIKRSGKTIQGSVAGASPETRVPPTQPVAEPTIRRRA